MRILKKRQTSHRYIIQAIRTILGTQQGRVLLRGDGLEPGLFQRLLPGCVPPKCSQSILLVGVPADSFRKPNRGCQKSSAVCSGPLVSKSGQWQVEKPGN